MRSLIDWNEIVPLLKKDLRETLMIEAVLILSTRKIPAQLIRQRVRGGQTGFTSDGSKIQADGQRSWKKEGDGDILSKVGRRYRINKKADPAPSYGKIGAVWKHLMASKNESIAYDGLAAICKGAKAAPSATICQLWERRFIDVEAKKFIEALPGK